MKRIFPVFRGPNSKTVTGMMGSINNHNAMGGVNFYQSLPDKGMEFIEVWDYVGEASFRGFITEKRGSNASKTLFLFFQELGGLPLKDGYAPFSAHKLLIRLLTP